MEKLGDILLNRIVEAGLSSGHIKIEDLKDKNNLFKKIKKYLPKKDEDMFIQIIKYDSILEEANKFVVEKKWDFAYVFFATYLEHFINEIIIIWAAENSIKHETVKIIIRKVGIEDKFTWLIQLFKFPKFNDNLLKTLKLLSEKRNAFIHYKYEILNIDLNKDEDDEQEWKKMQKI